MTNEWAIKRLVEDHRDALLAEAALQRSGSRRLLRKPRRLPWAGPPRRDSGTAG